MQDGDIVKFMQQFMAFTLWPLAAFIPSTDHEHRVMQTNYNSLLNYVKGLERAMLHNPLEKCPHCGKLIPSGECKRD